MASTSASFACCLQMFPTPDLHRTAEYYENLGYRSVYYLESAEPTACMLVPRCNGNCVNEG